MSQPQPAIDYPALVREAFLGLVRGLLARVAEEGLPGDHHFYLTFATGEDGVELPPRLRRQFPREMTIVLQHQYWNLQADASGFAVTLRFGGAPERLVVPWSALRSFVDPSAEFGLQLRPAGEQPEAASDQAPEPAPAEAEPAGSTAAEPAPAGSTPAGSTPPAEGGGRKVVDLGSFRRRPPG